MISSAFAQAVRDSYGTDASYSEACKAVNSTTDFTLPFERTAHHCQQKLKKALSICAFDLTDAVAVCRFSLTVLRYLCHYEDLF